MDTEQALVRLENVRVTLGGHPALSEVSLDISQGERIALQGRNGAGKSTLLRVLRGEQFPDQKDGGQVTWFPDGSASADSAPLTGRAMSALVSPRLQEMYTRQAWRVTALELVLAGLYDDYLLYREPTADQVGLAHALAASLGASALLDKALPALSQGELRLILLLRALIRQPQILLLDEADEGLDERARSAFFAALESLLAGRPDLAVVLASHRQAPSFATRVIRMSGGRLVDPELQAEGAHSWEAECGRYPGVSVSLRACDVYLDRHKVLDGINLEIANGQSWLITGANGSGKTTLLRLIAGEENPAVGGSIHRFSQGRELVELAEIQKKIRLVSPRLQSLYPADSSVREVILSGAEGSIGLWREPEADDLTRAEEIMFLADLQELGERAFGSLSSGQMRNVLFARALLGQPALLLLDEPFAGLDAETREQLKEFLRGQLKCGLQMILVSHYREDLAGDIANAAVMERGRLRIVKTEDSR